jgi:peptide chain release factor
MSEVVLHLTAGKGPRECRWVVGQLARAFLSEAQAIGLDGDVFGDGGLGDGVFGGEAFDGAPFNAGEPASLLLRIAGEQAADFAAGRLGTVQWVGNSPFRPGHRRRNWFVGVSLALEPAAIPDLNEGHIDYQAMRASGPGGQHVNKTDSAVRAIHRPSGLVAIAQEQRSQHANRRLARLKLAIMLEERRAQAQEGARRAQWEAHQDLERGNSVRVYTGPRFRLKR